MLGISERSEMECLQGLISYTTRIINQTKRIYAN